MYIVSRCTLCRHDGPAQCVNRSVHAANRMSPAHFACTSHILSLWPKRPSVTRNKTLTASALSQEVMQQRMYLNGSTCAQIRVQFLHVYNYVITQSAINKATTID